MNSPTQEDVSITSGKRAIRRKKRSNPLVSSPLYVPKDVENIPLGTSPPPQEQQPSLSSSPSQNNSFFSHMKEEINKDSYTKKSYRSTSAVGNDNEKGKVDSLGKAFSSALWPSWSKAVLGTLIFFTLVAIGVLVVSRSWRRPPPALTFLQDHLCPLNVAYSENAGAPFTTWISGCPVARSGEPLKCKTVEDCWAAGSSCASAVVRHAMACRPIYSNRDVLGGTASSSFGASSSLSPSMYCQLSLPSTVSSSSDSLSYSPFCFSPSPHCGLYSGNDSDVEQLVACVQDQDCQENGSWICVT